MASATALSYRFGEFELDPARFELRERGEPVHLEPQVLALLIELAANPDRLVSKDELIEKVWGGRIVSEAAVASRIKSARQVLGDDGKRQRFIRTVHGKGFRFVAPVTFHECEIDRPNTSGHSHADTDEPPPPSDLDPRPSIAVLPFRFLGRTGPLSFLSDALADEFITDLSRLRWLIVIARGSSFRFRYQEVDHSEVGRALRVRYCLSGSVRKDGRRLTIFVELARTSDASIIWAERFSAGLDELRQLREEVVAAVVANLEMRIQQQEAQFARGRPLGELDAWSACHVGVDLMYRFNRPDNAQAAAHFEHALSLDGEFSRALAGLSFTRFQDAFMQYSDDPHGSAEQARSLAERARQCDPLDPFAYLNLGRSLWLDGQIPESIELLNHSIALSPNYAQAYYSKAWAEMTQCKAGQSDTDATLALRLSPLDPLRYAFLGVRSISALLRGDYRNAAEWGERAARSPGAHKHIAVIAALGTRLAGRRDRASEWVSWAKRQDSALSKESFLRSFPFAPSAEREVIEATLRDLRL